MPTVKKLFIIDAMAMAFRNYHAFGVRPLMTSKGVQTSAVFGSALFMTKLIEDEKPDLLVVATDCKEKTFRHDMYPDYKANRSEMPADLADQLPYFFKLFSALKIPLLKCPGVEADDLIGSVCMRYASEEIHCYIVSGDKDFMQLVSPHVSIYAPKKNEPALILNKEGVREKFGCLPEQVIDVLALIGDASDHVPGVRGIGEKGAAKLIADYHNLEGIYDHLEQIQNAKIKNALIHEKDMAFLSRRLVTIKTDVPVEASLEAMIVKPDALGNSDLIDLFTDLEFKGLLTKTKALASTSLNTSDVPVAAVSVGVTPVKDDIGHQSQAKYGIDYRLANTPEYLMSCVQELKAASVFSFDTETTGLDRLEDKPIGMSFSTKCGTAWYVPLAPQHLQGWLSPDYIKAQFAPIFADTSKRKVAHNLKFDLQMLRNIGLVVSGPFGDTMLASYVLNPLGREHNLDQCALDVLKFKKIPTIALMGPKKQTPMLEVPLEQLTVYACEDADVVLQLETIFESQLKAQQMWDVYNTIEVPLAPILARMEQAGIHVDADALAEISEKLDLRIKSLEKTIYAEAGEEFNINSTKQLQTILFEKLAIHTKLGLTRLKKTKTGFSTDVSVLESMDAHPLPQALLEYRTISKLKNTYVDTLPQLIHPKSGRVHTSFHQTGTATGRLSSSDPNLQNIPIRKEEGRLIRKAFNVSAPDRVMISADYSQIELRLLAHITGDEGLKTAFASGHDVHTATASKIFAVTPDQVTTDLRSAAKAINFGIIYGMGSSRLARETGVSNAEAKIFIEKYFEGFPRIRSYIENAKTVARQLGYSTTMTGRRRPIPELQAKERMIVVNGENMAVNSPIQGSAADLVKLAMIETQRRLDASKIDAEMLLQVHDELVFECHRTVRDEVMTLVKESMEHAMELAVPLKVEVGFGLNWLEAH